MGIGRRQFISVLGGAAVAWPPAARAQQPKMPVVGFLADGTPEGFAPRVAGFKRGLSDTGFIEGRNVAIKSRWAHGNYDLLPALADDFVREHVSAIVTAGTEKVTRAAKNATTTIPIVATVAGDPVKRGLVASINRPGGNLTVVSLFTASSNPLVAKRVEIMHELVPNVTTVGWLVDTNILDYDDELHDIQRATEALGLKLAVARVGADSEIEAAFASLIRNAAGALLDTGPVFYGQSRAGPRPCCTRARTGDVRMAHIRRRGWSDELWERHQCRLSASGRLCGPCSKRRKRRRSTRCTAKQNRIDRQS